ncbi:hypothetical protein [Nafulsella turpanensis]|uniref:hypothetical protein n=1 Tax=Nafulsella turpanensis TaxID=1265690 RepID=UPI0003746ED5|nr:hypothetical protein [Nafulsella turpanensis]
MEIGKKSNRMARKILLLLLSQVIISCTESKTSSRRNQTPKVHEEDVRQEAIFTPDSTIHGVLKLHNRTSLDEFYGETERLKLVDSLREAYVLPFCNRNGSQYLFGYQYEGNEKLSFSVFEIGYVKKDMEVCEARVDVENFSTESGIKLGMPLEELLELKGKEYEFRSDSLIIYKIDDYSGSEFLQKYNMPAYFLECSMNASRVSKIKLGFEYP